jgi:hypothetical protein
MSKPKILILDIETSPVLAKVWSLWKQNVSLSQIEDDWFMMSYSAKWLGNPAVIYQDCRDDIGNDKALLEGLHDLLDESDIVVAHNGDKFDIKKINARFMLNGFYPPSPYKTVDTLKVAKKSFAFTSNKLAYLTDKLCTVKKLDHAKYAGFTLWNECLKGNTDAWEEMKIYNEYDVLSLEELYLRLLPWATNHPSVTSFDDEESYRCPKCGGYHVQKRGFSYTNKGKYQRYYCKGCGGWSKATYTENTRNKRQTLLSPM